MKTITVGFHKIRQMNYAALKELKDILQIEEFHGKPIAVLIPYEHYLDMQSTFLGVLECQQPKIQDRESDKPHIDWND